MAVVETSVLFPDNMPGTMVAATDNPTVDNIFVLSDGTTSYYIQQTVEGVYNASWLFSTVNPTDKTSLVNTVLSDSRCSIFVVDVDVVVSGAITVPAGKAITFVHGGSFTGTYSISGSVLDLRKINIQESGSIKLTGYGSGTNSGTATYYLATDSSGNVIEVVGSGGGSVSFGSVGSSPNANGGTITSGVIHLQPADASNPGVVNTSTQEFSGDKTLNGVLYLKNNDTIKLYFYTGGVYYGCFDVASYANSWYAEDGSQFRLRQTSANVLSCDPSFFRVYALAGVGTRMVTVDSAGNLGSSSLPTSGMNRSISSVSVNTSAGSLANTEYVYLVSGTTTITLPTAVGNTNTYTIKRVGTNNVTINTTSSQTIDGSLTAVITNQYTSLTLVSDGTNWAII